MGNIESKFKDFLKVAKILNDKNIVPVLYGSLGLYQIIKPLSEIDDIDMLVSDEWLKDRWPEFKAYLESHGFRMDDEHEHEFSHPDIKGWIAFASIQESHIHSGLNRDDLQEVVHDGVNYLVLTPEQYLRAYRACLKDSYRQSKKGDADLIKIKALEEYRAR